MNTKSPRRSDSIRPASRQTSGRRPRRPGQREAFAKLLGLRPRDEGPDAKTLSHAQQHLPAGEGKSRRPHELETERERPSPKAHESAGDRAPDTTPAYLDAQGHFSPALLPPVGEVAAPAPRSTALEQAQAAALAERMLSSVRVGRTRAGHEVRLTLRDGDLEVRLEHVDGVLRPTLVGDGDLSPLARRLESELHARGLRFDRIELEGR